MSASRSLALPEVLEQAASALPALAESIRPANGDPLKLLGALDAEAAAMLLDWLLRHEPGASEELVEAWLEAGPEGAEALRGVSPDDLGKEGRKMLRRAHHRLRSRGVALEAPAPRPVVAKLPPVEDRLEMALLSGLDPRGARVAYLVQSNPSGGTRLFELMLDDVRGIIAFEVYSAGRSRIRKFLRDAAGRPGMSAVEAPAPSVRALVARQVAQQPADRPLPRGFSEWRSSVAQAPEGTATPGELAREALGEPEADAEALARVAERVRKHEIGPWPPSESTLRPLAEKLTEIGSGRIIVSGLRRREQLDAAMAEAVETFFDERFAAATARRFEESAYMLWKAEREGEARDALSAARAFREGPPRSDPVARAMLDTALAPVLSGVEEELAKEDEGSLLVKP